MLKKNIPSIILPFVFNSRFENKNIFDSLKKKKVIIFGVPGAFTPTCSEYHLPGYIKLYDQIIESGIDDIYCLSVNDPYVVKSWLSTYSNNLKIIGIADGNADFSDLLNLTLDKSNNFMGKRCSRFAMIVSDNIIKHFFIEKTSQLDLSSAEKIIEIL
jgi:peroxiredoxin